MPKQAGVRRGIGYRTRSDSAPDALALHDDGVLPHGEEILDAYAAIATSGLISATQNIAHVKPAKAERRQI